MITDFNKFKLFEEFSFQKKNPLHSLFHDERSEEQRYYDKIKSCLTDILTSERRISEKDFKNYDIVMKELAEKFQESNVFRIKLNELMEDFEKAKSARPQYWAELAYHKLYKEDLSPLNRNL